MPDLQIKHWVGYLNNDSFKEGRRQWETIVQNEKMINNDLVVFRLPGNSEKQRMAFITEIEKLLQNNQV